MRRWIDFVDRLGTDSMVPIDGRYGTVRIHELARDVAQRQQRIYPSMVTRQYRVIAGFSLRDAGPISLIRTIYLKGYYDSIQPQDSAS